MYCWIKIPSIRLQSNVLSACNLLHRRRTIGLAFYLQMSKIRMYKQMQRVHQHEFCECESQVGCSLELPIAQTEKIRDIYRESIV